MGPSLVMDHRKHKGSIIERLLEITKKILQLREAARKVI